jgi:hypothetical protein
MTCRLEHLSVLQLLIPEINKKAISNHAPPPEKENQLDEDEKKICLLVLQRKKAKHNPSNAPSKNRMYPMQQSKQNNFKILS